jgi:hypothetical protein
MDITFSNSIIAKFTSRIIAEKELLGYGKDD